MVLFIAIGLALPVILSGIIFRQKKVTLFAAIIMAGVGVATGNPHYIMADLIGVVAGYFIGIQFSSESKK
jgi:hypothetical protein